MSGPVDHHFADDHEEDGDYDGKDDKEGEEELVDHLLMNTVIMMVIVAMRNGDKVDHNPMNTILGKRRWRFKVFTPSPHI